MQTQGNDLRNAIQNEDSLQNIASRLQTFSEQAMDAYIKPMGDYSVRAWNTATDYVRRHPVQAAVGVFALSLLTTQLLKKSSSTLSSDHRSY